MRLILDWRVYSSRLDRLLEVGCSHCRAGLGRLVRHDAGRGSQQIWLACCNCCARLGVPLPHGEHPRRDAYPLWSESLSEAPEPEELSERQLITLAELLAEIPRRSSLELVRRAEYITVGYNLCIADIADLSRALPTGDYAALEFRDSGARLLRFEKDKVRILTPHRRGSWLDLSDRTTLQIVSRRSP